MPLQFSPMSSHHWESHLSCLDDLSSHSICTCSSAQIDNTCLLLLIIFLFPSSNIVFQNLCDFSLILRLYPFLFLNVLLGINTFQFIICYLIYRCTKCIGSELKREESEQLVIQLILHCILVRILTSFLWYLLKKCLFSITYLGG